MAQPIYFAPGYESPSRLRMEESMLKAQALEQGIQGVTGALQSYLDNKTKAKYEKLSTMNTMVGTYGGEALGPHFQHEYGTMLHTMGIDLPQDEAGLYKIPTSFEDKLRSHIMSHPELIPTLIGAQRPELSPGELHYKDQEIQVKEETINARLEAQRLLAEARDEATKSRLAGIEATIAGKHEDVQANIAGRINIAQITAGGKPYAAPSGVYNYKGKFVPAAIVEKNFDKYPGAYALNAGQYQMMLNNKKTREMTTDMATKASLVELKLRQDLQNDQLKPFLMTIGAAVKTKNTNMSNAVLSSMVSQLNQVEGWGLTEQDMTNPGFISFVKGTVLPLLSNSNPSAKAADPVQKPQAPAPVERKMPDGTIIYEQEHP